MSNADSSAPTTFAILSGMELVPKMLSSCGRMAAMLTARADLSSVKEKVWNYILQCDLTVFCL